MAQLIVRNLDETLVRALKRRAARHGRSAEAEHREILRAALDDRARQSFHEMLREMPDAGEDRDFERPRQFGRRVKL